LQELSNAEWHSLSLDKVIEILQTDIEKGFTSIDVKRRLEEFGENVISIKRGKNQLFSFLLQFKQPFDTHNSWIHHFIITGMGRYWGNLRKYVSLVYGDLRAYTNIVIDILIVT